MVEPGDEVDCVENVRGSGSTAIGKDAKVGTIKNVVWVGKTINLDDFE